MADIAIEDLTDGSLDANNDWVGEGVFDKLIMAVNKNIEGQYLKDRIKGTDYANVYLGSMQTVVTQSIQYLVQEQQMALAERKQTESEATSAKNREVLEAQKALYDRQAAGFDDDAKQKLLKVVIDSWSVAYSTAPDGVAIPDTITKQNIDKIAENAMHALGMEDVVNMASANPIDGAY